MLLDDYAAVWLVDFEFRQPDGELPQPCCMVARDFHSGRLLRLWEDELRAATRAPFPTGPQSLFVSYYASAELGCFLTLNWPMPARILDLCAEFKNLTSGLSAPNGRGLLGALAYHGIDARSVAEKESMRLLAMRAGPYTGAERAALLDYCQSDVDALAKLLPTMLPRIDLPRALLRGRYMAAAARMEAAGIPIDMATLISLRERWDDIRLKLVQEVDQTYGVYEGLTFKTAKFAAYLAKQNIPWPILERGNLALDDDTFEQQARTFPALSPLRELRKTLAKLRLNSLAVGTDGRNRRLLSAFGSKTGRNQPSTSEFVFGLPAWARGLIQPPAGQALAYLDYEQQEFGIAAALSGDEAMQAAYSTGDPYLAFAKQARAVPPDATKASHPGIRDQFKTCALGVQYGMEAAALARSLNRPEAEARELLRLHRETYPRFWRWSQAAVDFAMLHGYLQTVFGWRVHVPREANPRSLANFPMQANGAEMLRLACCTATEAGICICAPVHDAVLIEAPAAGIDAEVAVMQKHMRSAAEVVLGGFGLRTEAVVVRHPARYADKRGVGMWNLVMRLLREATHDRRLGMEPARFGDTPPGPETGNNLPVSGTPGTSYIS